jgi:outer membrane protein
MRPPDWRCFLRIAVCATALQGHVSEAADLLTLYQSAMADNPLLKVREFGIERARAEAEMASSQLYPQISLQASKSRNDYRDTASSLDYGGQRATLIARQAIFDLPSVYRRDSARYSASQSEREAELARMELTAQLTDEYLRALQADDELAQLQAEKEAASRQVQRLRAMLAREMVKITDLAEAVAYQQQLLTREIDSMSKAKASRLRLRELSGRDPGPLAVLVRSEFPAVPDTEASWVNAALEANPDIAARKQAVMASRSGADSARAAHWPQLFLSLQRTQSNQDIDNSPRRDFTVNTLSLELRVPIYEGGRTSAAESSALAQWSIAQQQLENTQRTVERDTRINYASAQANRARIDSTDNETLTLSQSVQAQERGYELGVVTVIGVLDARRRLLRARADQAKARYDYLRDLVGLRLRAGRLGATDIAEFNGWLGMANPQQ